MHAAHVLLQVATFIVQKILLDEMGLNYICATAERFYAVRYTLAWRVTDLRYLSNHNSPSPELHASFSLLLSGEHGAQQHGRSACGAAIG